jgi:carbohydrate esterase-like sialic acid-specific acetylesterase
MTERKHRTPRGIRGGGMLMVAWVVLGCGLQEHPRGSAITLRPPAPPPPSDDSATVGVDIDGVHIPRDRAIAFIHFGHSNMAGVAQTPEEMRPMFFTTDPHLWSYRGSGTFVAAIEPTAPDPPKHDGAGPGMAWLRTAAAVAAPGYTFISVAWARGSATSGNYLKGSLYYSKFMDLALELKGRVTFGGVFIMLGITEIPPPPGEEGAFADRMAQIVADIRQDLGEPALPVLHTDYEVESTGLVGPMTADGMRLRTQFAWLPLKIHDLALIPADHLPMADDHHFDLTGHKLWAERGIQIMQDRGWFPWTE